ncbi:MAG: DUF421 domain-containing protein [Ruminococcus sp.]|nr:DUF421 domain-containing protein [Ruminococcus sp.]MCD7801164.1 DUF421 domain-containing protein [Ruminococcus sp.]
MSSIDFMDIIRVILASIFSVVALFLLTKLIGNRQMSQLSMFDYINGITIGSIAAEITYSEEFILPIIAMVIYALFSILVSYWASKSVKCRRFLNGTPLILFDNGNFNLDSLKKSRLDLNELLGECRNQGYFNVKDIQTIVLETNGKISVLSKSDKRPTTPEDLNVIVDNQTIPINLIVNGKVISDNLKASGKNDVWLKNQLDKLHINSAKDVLLAFCDETNSLTAFKY